MVRTSKAPEERKQEIVESAQKLFLERGYAQTKVSDIVKDIGVSQGVFYYYFPTKEAVVEEIIDGHIERHLNEARDVLRNRDWSALKKLEEMANRQFRINALENNNIHAIKGVDIHERILSRLVQEYVPLMVQAFGKTGSDDTRLRFEIFFVAGNMLFDPGVFAWSREEKNQRIDGLIAILEENLGQPQGSLAFYRNLMGYK